MNGVPVAFTYDWPEYTMTEQQQEALTIDGIWERANALAATRFPGKTIMVKRFECGYVDMGIRPGGEMSVHLSKLVVQVSTLESRLLE